MLASLTLSNVASEFPSGDHLECHPETSPANLPVAVSCTATFAFGVRSNHEERFSCETTFSSVGLGSLLRCKHMKIRDGDNEDWPNTRLVWRPMSLVRTIAPLFASCHSRR